MALNHAKEVILSGGVVAVPTESFYGLAVSVRDENAIHRLMFVKQRPEKNPILILISSADDVDRYVAQIPPMAMKLIRRFWPGSYLGLQEKTFHQCSRRLLAKSAWRLSLSCSTELAVTGVAITGTSANVSRAPGVGSGREGYRE
jgi:L-threonylcarbamoyladenylate synthase